MIRLINASSTGLDFSFPNIFFLSSMVTSSLLSLFSLESCFIRVCTREAALIISSDRFNPTSSVFLLFLSFVVVAGAKNCSAFSVICLIVSNAESVVSLLELSLETLAVSLFLISPDSSFSCDFSGTEDATVLITLMPFVLARLPIS